MSMKRGIRMSYEKHGLRGIKEYSIWSGMKKRCNPLTRNKKDKNNYSDRGIVVSDRWVNSFSNFYNDMGSRPTPSHSIERIDNNGDYEPSNCRWATAKEQAENRRNSIYLSAYDVTMTVADWSRVLEISDKRIYDRTSRGYNDHDALFCQIKMPERLFFKNQFLTIKEWSTFLGVNEKRFYDRRSRGWSDYDALFK